MKNFGYLAVVKGANKYFDDSKGYFDDSKGKQSLYLLFRRGKTVCSIYNINSYEIVFFIMQTKNIGRIYFKRWFENVKHAWTNISIHLIPVEPNLYSNLLECIRDNFPEEII